MNNIKSLIAALTFAGAGRKAAKSIDEYIRQKKH